MGDGNTGSPETAGARFGKYTVLRKLGEGAFGSVYEAIQPGAMGFTKRVAIKRIRPHLLAANPGFVEAMAQEARLGGLLHHAHIVDVLEFDQVDGHHYLAMEYVDGATLGQVLSLCAARGVLLPRFAVLDLAIQVCRGLHFAHGLRDAAGRPLELVHRDLKPSNVLVDREGTARIADFGIAKVASDLGHTASTGAIKGTPRYMSPEQIGGGRVTARSDIFAMGALLHETITGRPLFVADSLPALAHRIMEADLGPGLDEAEAALPGSRPILDRALQREEDARYPDARALADDLRLLAREYPVEVDMAEVIGRLMPVVEQTMSGELMDSAAFDRELATGQGPLQPRPPSGTGWESLRPGDGLGNWDEFTAAFEATGEPLGCGVELAIDPSAEREREGELPVGVWRLGWVAVVIGVVGILGAIGVGVWRGVSEAETETETETETEAEAETVADGRPTETETETAPAAESGLAGPAGPAGKTPPVAADRRSAPAAELSALGDEMAPRGDSSESESKSESATEADGRPTATATAPEISPGTLSLYTVPFARIYVDGEYLGQLNRLKSHALEGGAHQIRLVCPSKDNREKVFEVEIDGQLVDLGCWDFGTMAVCEGT